MNRNHSGNNVAPSSNNSHVLASPSIEDKWKDPPQVPWSQGHFSLDVLSTEKLNPHPWGIYCS
ncbi:hypothetical protein I79_020646 [Cricetulus griseus]|uniref:Uncharacterized protein n=1 Tax=Cricetulus griseus TaxID=10029 RepID=G3IAM1_CRIGR|nr:hypothetical protein I79_020646 [Cricetulus griseus]